ncbi:mitogen-activated protein kinase kinase kinase 7-like isoform X3 [Anneissia japonica]|uniref:mitogen-activated protein kinase kinase kinase 7-like isoform X3 n=1 Tax=Anneissia japonica TaxID=1529436 RepID=UPI0014258816|nr:mitogen-activated protein kinase kinase kinase 7-like isoform X3 [Anneissia japonica]
MQTVYNCTLGGTPSHMPPEYFSKKGSPNKSWDVYSFGILLYEVASGKTVFEEIGSDVQRLMFCVVMNEDRPEICDSYPAFIKELMMKCWGTNSDNRPNFKEIKLAIRRAYEDKYEISILEAIIKVLTQLKDQQCMTELDARMSNLQTRGRQIENQEGSSELVIANEANKKTATMNQMSDEQNDKFIQTASCVNTAVLQSTGRPIPANSSTESHREITVSQSTGRPVPANSSTESHREIKPAPISPRRPVSANYCTESRPEIKNGEKILTDGDKQCVLDYLTEDNFQKLAKKFGLKPGQISSIKIDNSSYNDQVYALIEKWERKNGRRTRRQLCECLRDVDCTIIDELNKL